MKKIFIDCGAHFGESTKLFLKKKKNYEIHMFEPNPFTKVAVPKKATLHNRAVWTNDCTKKFYVYNNDKSSEGCTLFKHKIGNIDKEHPVNVMCIDFGAWVKETFDKDDYIICKMDIEGAEYEVLRHMLTDGSIDWINDLYMEWHCKRVGLDKKDHRALVAELRGRVTLHKEFADVW